MGTGYIDAFCVSLAKMLDSMDSSTHSLIHSLTHPFIGLFNFSKCLGGPDTGLGAVDLGIK